MDKRLRVGVIGTGRWATVAHVPGFRSCPNVEVVALCGRSRERAETVARDLGIPRVYTSAAAMLADGGVDIVSVVSADDHHVEDAGAALAAGIHVLCEKPLAVTYPAARALADAARSTGVRTKLGFALRYAPAVMRLKELIEGGAIGTPHLLQAFQQNGQFARPETPRHWKMEPERTGGGAVVEYGVHTLDLARWLMGEVRRVCASGRTLIPERPLPDGGGMAQIEVDDSCGWLMDFEHGALGVCHAGWATVGRPPGLELRVYGSEGAARCVLSDDLPGAEALSLATLEDQRFLPSAVPDRLSALIPADGDWAYRFPAHLIRQFVDEVRRGVGREPTFEDGARAQELLEALLVSMREERWVALAR